MELLLILTYTAICVAIFKIFNIPLTKWSVPTAALGGVALLSTLFVLMNYNHPYSEISREYFVTTPIIPNVSGMVIEVPAVAMSKLNEGDILFRLDPEPFEHTVSSLTAQTVLAQADARRATELLKTRNISQRDADAAFARLENLSGDLATAEYELDETIIRAPTDGYVAQMTLRPGMRAVAAPLRPVMIFVHKESKYFIGWFRQNSLLRLIEGSDAEVAFDGIPGKVFTGKVATVIPALAEGQVQPSGNLINPLAAPFPGRVAVLIDITDPEFDAFEGIVPGGAYAQAAIYSEHFHHVAVLRKILLRMSSWLNYLFPFH